MRERITKLDEQKLRSLFDSTQVVRDILSDIMTDTKMNLCTKI